MKHSKLYVLITIVLTFSLIGSLILKQFGLELFIREPYTPTWFTSNIQFAVEYIMMCFQFILIVAIITWIPVGKLATNFLAFGLINIVPYLASSEYHMIISLILTVSTVLVIKPKLITLVSTIVNLFIIVLIQYILILIRADLVTYVNPFFDTTTLLLMNIDQFLLLAGLYYINRKVGEKLELVFIRRKNKS